MTCSLNPANELDRQDILDEKHVARYALPSVDSEMADLDRLRVLVPDLERQIAELTAERNRYKAALERLTKCASGLELRIAVDALAPPKDS